METKRILGLDLVTNSIGWALVDEAQNEKGESRIIRTGVRIVPLSSDESGDFEKGKSTSINADRTLKRGARRSLQRYKQRREHLISILTKHGIMTSKEPLTETGKGSTYELLDLRNRAAISEIELHELARVLLTINKKRGYKSSRKAKDESEGTSIDGMETAKFLYNENLTPGQLMYQRLSDGKKNSPEFYPSDLENEFEKIWEYQSQFYANLLNDDFKERIKQKSKIFFSDFKDSFQIEGISLNGKASEV
ncbi:MAG: type II CRISPR RNA-guided endonuclease Cas9, partial [Bacteroidia bacterium]